MNQTNESPDAPTAPARNRSGIVVGIDGSSGSDRALAWASERTDQFGPIRAVAAWQYPWWTMSGQPTAAGNVPSYERLAELARRQAEDAVSTIPAHQLSSLTVEEGAAGPLLLQHGVGAEMIVIGTRGRGAVADTLLGSVSCHVVSHGPVPVAVVPPEAPIEPPQRRVVVGVDGSDNSVGALAWALRNTPTDHEIEVVHTWSYVVAAFPEGPMIPVDDLEAAARATMDRTIAAATEAAQNERVVTCTITQGDPRAVLREACDRADLMVLGARGHRGLLHAMLGSVTTSLVHNPSVPTVVIPAP